MTTGVNLEALGASGLILRLRKSPPPAGPGLPHHPPPPPRGGPGLQPAALHRRVVLVPSRPPHLAPPGRGPRLPGGAPGWVLTKRHSGKETSLPKPVLPCALPRPDRAGGSEHPDPTTFGVTRRPSGSPPLPGAGTGRPGYLVSPVPRNRPDHGSRGSLRLARVAAKGLGGPARAGLHRPLLGKRQTCSEGPAGTSRCWRVRRDGGPRRGLQSWRSSWRPPAQRRQGTCPESRSYPRTKSRAETGVTASLHDLRAAGREAFPQQAPVPGVRVARARGQAFVHRRAPRPLLTATQSRP